MGPAHPWHPCPWVTLARGLRLPGGPITRGSCRPGVVATHGSHGPGVTDTQGSRSPVGAIARGCHPHPVPSPCLRVTLLRGIQHPWVLSVPSPWGLLAMDLGLWVPLTHGWPCLWVPSPHNLLSPRGGCVARGSVGTRGCHGTELGGTQRTQYATTAQCHASHRGCESPSMRINPYSPLTRP